MVKKESTAHRLRNSTACSLILHYSNFTEPYQYFQLNDADITSPYSLGTSDPLEHSENTTDVIMQNHCRATASLPNPLVSEKKRTNHIHPLLALPHSPSATWDNGKSPSLNGAPDNRL